jgi:glycosyltransferase involved in cell wall biosynthesis
MPRIEGGRRTRGHIVTGSETQPLVSIITVVFNGARHVGETIRAIEAQTYPHIEHIVIDGGSTDGTVDILRRHDGSIGYWASESDNGLYDAMNKGVALVSDPESYVLFANADDSLHSPDVIARVIAESRGEDLVYGRMLLTDDEISGTAGREVTFDDLARQTLCHPATFVRRRIFDSVGKFDTAYVIAADYDHIVRCFAAGVSTRFVDVIVSRMRMGGLSDDRFMLSCRERKNVIRRNFPLVPRLAGVWQVNLYDIPRNSVRRWLAQAGLLRHWRALKGSPPPP